MGRWKPDSRRRLQEAALEVYAEQGYDQATAAAVAGRAGLTERTFFRHFPDKREVLFGEEAALQETLVQAVLAAPAAATPYEAVLAGLTVLARELQQRRDALVRRAWIVARSAELRERELAKLASWSAALGTALRRRGTGDPMATYAAEASVAAFRVAVVRWIDAPRDAVLLDLVHEGFAELERFLPG